MNGAQDSFFDFLLPDVGEGLEEAEIVEWKVVLGQEVSVNQVVVEIETAKSLVELPTPFAGKVLELLATEGQSIRVGVAILRIQLESAKAPTAAILESNSERREILVGSGPQNDAGVSRRRVGRNYRGSSTTPTSSPAYISLGLAKPPVRKLARDLGVDLSNFLGSGVEGSVTRDDVLKAAARNGAGSGSNGEVTPPPTRSSIDSSREIRTPIRGVRKVMAEAMVASAFSAPHVTEFITVDVTASMDLLTRLRDDPVYKGLRLSPMTLLARAICIAARATPEINSYWDGPAGEIVTKQYVNLGIATATERGLLVPNIKDAHQMNLKELASAIAESVASARAGKMKPAEMVGGTISITNIGIFGIEGGTPILPPGESAIICLGAVVERPWVIDGEIVVRQVTTLSLSFDHRLVDGAQGSTFLAAVAAALQAPESTLL